MSDNKSIIPWICFLVVASLTTGQSLHAEDNSTLPTKDTTVPVKVGNSTTNIKVQESDPYKNLHVPAPTDKYDPTRYSLNQTSPMANKSFSSTTNMMSRKSADFSQDQTAFTNKAYGQTSATDIRNSNTKFSTSASEESIHGDSQFNKNYNTPTSSMGSSKSEAFTNTSNDQNRTSSLSGQKSDVFASNMSKQYLGPGAQHVPDGLVKENVVIAHVTDLPNRPLTIDEVRGLINHGFKPDTTAAPGAPSKAINDPNYKPEASPEPPDVPVARAPVVEDDRDTPLPGPGMMSQPPPENSESLPQH